MTIKNRVKKILRRKINIQSKSKKESGRLLSNFANTPFVYGGFLFSSVESALQGIKFENKEKRKEVFEMSAKEAMLEGRSLAENANPNEQRFVYWNNEKIPYNSEEHRLLLAAFIREKIRQNKSVREALISTNDNFIYHDVGEESPHTSLPEEIYIEILLSERKILKKIKEIKK